MTTPKTGLQDMEEHYDTMVSALREIAEYRKDGCWDREEPRRIAIATLKDIGEEW